MRLWFLYIFSVGDKSVDVHWRRRVCNSQLLRRNGRRSWPNLRYLPGRYSPVSSWPDDDHLLHLCHPGIVALYPQYESTYQHQV